MITIHGRFFFSCVLMFIPSIALAQSGVELSPLEQRVQTLHQRINELVDEDNLLDTLYFAWSDRPYARATLAILIKVAATLNREVTFRENNKCKMDDETVESMLQWSDDAIQRVIHAQPTDGFRPHRMKVTWTDVLDGHKVPPLFAFVDGTKLAPRDPALGDLDLLAVLGQRAYICSDPSNSATAAFETRARRAEALGMMVVDAVPAGTPGRCGSCLLNNRPRWPERGQRVVWMDSRVLVNGDPEFLPGELPAVLNDQRGESVASLLARRAMVRGVTRRPANASCHWMPQIPGKVHDKQVPPSTSMWIQAIDGQQLTLMEGWCDVHDTTWPHRPSVFTDPVGAELIANTALDFLRLGEFVKAVDANPQVAIVVGRDAFAKDESSPNSDHLTNSWAAWAASVWDSLVSRQIRFDVIPRAEREDGFRYNYPVVIPLERPTDGQTDLLIEKIERRLAQIEEHVYRLTAREMDGTLARDMFVRVGQTREGKACAGIVNLSNRPRVLKLRGRPVIGPSRDVISDQQIPEPDQRLDFAPWQVRLLWPVP